MVEDAAALATLIFAAIAGIGGVVRIPQNERYWRNVSPERRQTREPLGAILASLVEEVIPVTKRYH